VAGAEPNVLCGIVIYIDANGFRFNRELSHENTKPKNPQAGTMD
jgi:hypothetical protein